MDEEAIGVVEVEFSGLWTRHLGHTREVDEGEVEHVRREDLQVDWLQYERHPPSGQRSLHMLFVHALHS